MDDFGSICLLVFLYILQGVPLGLITAVPLLLQTRGVTYSQQAVFSLVWWPYSLKLLWAPVVDAVYVKRIGRRKSWTVLCQYLIGILLLCIAYYTGDMLGSETGREGKEPNVIVLTAMLLPITFLAATQDVAVDGWTAYDAIAVGISERPMSSACQRHNVGFAPTCDMIGMTFGHLLGNAVFLTIQSKEFANKWIRTEPGDRGLVEFDRASINVCFKEKKPLQCSEFAFVWGCFTLVATTVVFIFKREVDHSLEDEHRASNRAGPGLG
ncbi:acetyl-coenzyme A transporter 1-like protein [Aphelenchoides avenae]|nr:acetyl-coenzyme A transporter 1-like protein [Aphelenchus avenae]